MKIWWGNGLSVRIVSDQNAVESLQSLNLVVIPRSQNKQDLLPIGMITHQEKLLDSDWLSDCDK